jgi:hypothetical protein
MKFKIFLLGPCIGIKIIEVLCTKDLLEKKKL